MSWAHRYDEAHKRDIGYGVTAYCDHPGCTEVIDRGLSYRCGSVHSDDGCGLYFCGNHLYTQENSSSGLCERCIAQKDPFPPKPDHPDWIKLKLENEIEVRIPNVELFELDATSINGDYFRFHAHQTEELFWRGQEYSKWPIQVEGITQEDKSSQLVPTLSLGNVDGSISALCVYFGDLIGAKLNHYLIPLDIYLARNQFKDLIQEKSDDESIQSNHWFIKQKIAADNEFVKFELSKLPDLRKLRIGEKI